MAGILVTGAAGFIGAAVVRALAARGERVIAVDAAPVGRFEVAGSVVAAQCDLAEWPRLLDLLASEKPAAVIHCAAVVGVVNSVRAPLGTMRVNVEGSLNLIEAMRIAGIRRLIHMSSEETYGAFEAGTIAEDHPQRPLMAYGISKLAVEQLARSYRRLHGIETVNLRTSWVYGPGLPRLRVPRIFLEAALRGEDCHLAGGAGLAVDHTYIDDAVAGILGALDCAAHPFDAYNIGSGEATSLGDMVTIIREMVPDARISVGSGPYHHGDVGGVKVPGVAKGALDVSRAGRVFGYRPRFDIRLGLAAYFEALRRDARDRASATT